MKKFTLIAIAIITTVSLAGCSQSSKPGHHNFTKTEFIAKKKAKKEAAEKAKKKEVTEKNKEAEQKAQAAKQKQAKLAAQQATANRQAPHVQQNQHNQQTQQNSGQTVQQNQQPTEQQMINDPAKYSEQYRHSMASAEYRKWYYTPHYFDPDGNPITAQQHQELENQGAYNY